MWVNIITLYFCVVIIFHLLCLWPQCSRPLGPALLVLITRCHPDAVFPLPFFYFCGWDRVPLSSPGWPQTVGLLALVSQVLVPQVWPLTHFQIPYFQTHFVCVVPNFNVQRYCNIMLCFKIHFPLSLKAALRTVSEGTCCLPWQPEFNPKDPPGRRKQPWRLSSDLTHMLTHRVSKCS